MTEIRALKRVILLNLLMVAAVAIGGLTIGAASNPASARLACEEDGCSIVCGPFCQGECYDDPGPQKGCNMTDELCEVYNC